MSAVFKRNAEDEGMEMPVKEVVSRAMLCAMFNLNKEEPLHIFNANGKKEASLLVLDAEFAPKTAGVYFIKLESDFKYSTEAIFPVNVIFDLFNGEKQMEIVNKGSPFAFLKSLNSRREIVLREQEAVSKDYICQVFKMDVNKKCSIQTPSKMLLKEFSEKKFMQDVNNFFIATIPGVHTIMQADAEADAVSSHKKSIFDAMDRGIILDLLERLSYPSFCRLSITCHDMLSTLQQKIFRKETPLFLNVVTIPTNPKDFGLVVSRRNPNVLDPKAVIDPCDLADLKPFILQGVVCQGDIEKCEGAECLLKGCRAIQAQNIAYKTFYSYFNFLPVAEEMMKILKPKRAEIWLCRLMYPRKIYHFDEDLTGRRWPFESVTEEVKIVTMDSSYLQQMQRDGQMFRFISRVKIFQAFVVLNFNMDVIRQFFNNFRQGHDLGKLQMVQFVFNGSFRTFNGLHPVFQNEYSGPEGGKRLRAGIVSENGERIAIVEIRSYRIFDVLTVAFTSFSAYQEELDKIYKKIDDLEKTVDHFFRV